MREHTSMRWTDDLRGIGWQVGGKKILKKGDYSGDKISLGGYLIPP